MYENCYCGNLSYITGNKKYLFVNLYLLLLFLLEKILCKNKKRPDKIQVVLHPYFVRPCSLLTVWLFARYESALNESLRQWLLCTSDILSWLFPLLCLGQRRTIFCFYNTDMLYALHFLFSPSSPPINDHNNMESDGTHSVPVLSLESAFLHLPLMQTPCFF